MLYKYVRRVSLKISSKYNILFNDIISFHLKIFQILFLWRKNVIDKAILKIAVVSLL